MKYEVIFFDADGTLWDFSRSEKKAFVATLKEFGITKDLNEIYSRYHMINEAKWDLYEKGLIDKAELRRSRVEELFHEFQLTHSVKAFTESYLKHIGQGKDLIEGAEEVCRYLAERYRLVMVTNGMTETQRSRMAGSLLEPYFETMIVSDEISVAKPDPGIFQHAMEAIDHRVKETVMMVGNSLKADVAGGINYGIDTCWVNLFDELAKDGMVPTYEITDIRELMKLL